MIVTTTENIPGTRVAKTFGQVFGLTVRSRSIGGNIAAGLKSLAGGRSDPTSSSMRMRVWYNASTGQRDYRPE